MIKTLFIILIVLLFTIFQKIMFLALDTTPAREAKIQIAKIRNSGSVLQFIAFKQISLKKQGADIFVKDQISVSQWYLYKFAFASVVGFLGLMVTKGLIKTQWYLLVTLILTIFGWFSLDLILRMKNKKSNEDMMADIVELSRSVLYGKRGGQYIADALKDSVLVVENKRLKIALIRMKNALDSGCPVDECLIEFEENFQNAEISSFCTVVKSLQATGQVDEALRTLENNIEGQQSSVNKRRAIVLENKTMIYVLLIAFDILALIVYCIIMKLMEIQIAF